MPSENKIDCPALHQRSDSYPYGDQAPRTVRMLKTVTADPMPGIGLTYIKGNAPVAKAGQTYPVWTNSHGAVTALMEDGTRLGLRPAEFEVDSWHDLAAAPAPQPHPGPIAWMVGTAMWWTKEEAERDAAATGKPITPFGPMIDTGEVERLRGENAQLREVIKHSDLNIQRQSLRISNQRTQLAEREALLREQSGKLIVLAARLIQEPLRVLGGYLDNEGPITRNKATHGVEQAGDSLGGLALEVRRVADVLSASAEPKATS